MMFPGEVVEFGGCQYSVAVKFKVTSFSAYVVGQRLRCFYSPTSVADEN
jgi:hypothetical protein